MNSSPLRLAVAGAGQIGKRHMEEIARNRDCVLSGIVDPAPAAQALAAGAGVPLYATLADMIEAARPHGVVIATPNHLHLEHALACLDAGIPALVEKPLAHSLDAGIRLCAAAEATNVPMLVGHHRRHSAIMAKAVDIVASGMLGQIVTVVGTALFYKAENAGYFDDAYAWRREPGGGPILINMIHEVGNLRALCGEIVEVQAFTSNATRQFPVEDTAAIVLRFESGALGTFMLSDTAASNRSWEHTSGEDRVYAKAHTDKDDCYLLAGTMGSLGVPTMRITRYASTAERSWHEGFDHSTIALDVMDPLARQMAHFCDVIRGTATPIVSVRDGLQNLRVIDAIATAAKTGHSVTLSDDLPVPTPMRKRANVAP